MKYLKELLASFSPWHSRGTTRLCISPVVRPGANSTKVESLTHVQAIHLRAGVNDPCGPLPIFGVILWFALLEHQFLFSEVKGVLARQCTYIRLAWFSRAMQSFSKLTQGSWCPGDPTANCAPHLLTWEFPVTAGKVNTPASKSAWHDFISTVCSLLFNNLWDCFLHTCLIVCLSFLKCCIY